MERRLAAILAADLVGYSRMVRADEEGTLRSFGELRETIINPKITQHRGRVFKLVGDGLLAEFSSTVDAVACCSEMQIAIAERNLSIVGGPEFIFRMGINLGDVVVDGDDIQGDGVNVAARLEQIAQPGGLCISDAVFEQVRDRLELTFADLGQQEFKNINRPVRTWGWSPASRDQNLQQLADRTQSALPDKPAIAVLPFDNMSGDKEQEYFSDGISEDIITALSRFRDFLVIARNSTFTYKGKAIDIREVTRELNARYVVEGSVRKSGDRIRVTAQLIDGDRGAHIWADRYDGVLEDVFDLQDEITTSIVTAIAPQYMSAEIGRAIHRDGMEISSWDLLMRARWHMGQRTSEDADKAEHLLREVLRQNPKEAAAHAWLAFLFITKVTWGWEQDPT